MAAHWPQHNLSIFKTFEITEGIPRSHAAFEWNSSRTFFDIPTCQISFLIECFVQSVRTEQNSKKKPFYYNPVVQALVRRYNILEKLKYKDFPDRGIQLTPKLSGLFQWMPRLSRLSKKK